MGLYLCIFSEDEELDGVEVGHYADFEFFRSTVTETLEHGTKGGRFPVLINHSDSDGQWSPDEVPELRSELVAIRSGLGQLPPIPFRAEWQQEAAGSVGLAPLSFEETFIDVDGEPLLVRLIHLCDVAIASHCPILFQ